MQRIVALVLLSWLAWTNAEHCEEVDLQGKPFNPRSLIVCRNGKNVYKSTDKSSCPDGWKIWAPETKQDWQTIVELNLHNVKNPHFLVDVTRPRNGCGGCRSPMNSNNPAQDEWRTSNGERWWLRDGGFGEPNGDYTANCYLGFWNTHNPNDIRFNDARCHYRSKDYLCTPMKKLDCTEPQYANALTGPCASQPAIFRHSNCTPGLCDAGSKLLTFAGDTKIEKCKELCDEGRKFEMPRDGLTEEVFFFRQNGRFHDVTSKTPDVTKAVTKGINYRNTGGNWPGTNRRDHFYVRWTGNINIKSGGRYDFWTSSDDGSKIYINGKKIVDNGGWHGMRERHGRVDLTSGAHDFVAEFFEGGGGAGMEVRYQGPDSNNRKVFIPGSAFSSGASSGPVLPGIFKTEGPCMAYSISPDSTCMLYTSCNSVGLDSTCDLNFLDKNLSTYKTCALPPVPTPAPTPNPTPAPPTPAPPPSLKNLGTNPRGQIGVCEGDCDSDSGCKGNLQCFQRDGYTTPPGCIGAGTSGWDYCYDPSGLPPVNKVDLDPKEKLDVCSGDCDSDDDCKTGLVCYQRSGTTTMPGCAGDAGKDWDYCMKPPTQLNDKGSNPRVTLEQCTGDCDRDSHCAKGLKCFQRGGFETVPGCSGQGGKGWDYCYDPSKVSSLQSVESHRQAGQ